MKFRIYRYNPDTDTAPYMQDFDWSLACRRRDAAGCADAAARQQDDSLSVFANPAAKACAVRMR